MAIHIPTVIDGMDKAAAQAALEIGGGAWTDPSTDHTASGTTQSVTVGEAVVFGNLLYLNANGKWYKSDANAVATMPGIRMALAAADANAPCSVLIIGLVMDETWNWATIGGLIYASAAVVGGLTQTAPDGPTPGCRCPSGRWRGRSLGSSRWRPSRTGTVWLAPR